MKALLEEFQLKTNFEGLVKLLAKHLYSEDDVFIRELVQNSHDAIQKRIHQDTNLYGKIEINTDNDKNTISFIDNGIGMDIESIKKDLSTIGESDTRNKILESKERGGILARKLIGQFGIGFLSAFVVAKKVIVRTKKLNTEESFSWENEGSLECRLYEDNLSFVGSEIIVEVQKDFSYLLNFDVISRSIKKYCDFLPFPVYINNKGPINNVEIPFYKTHWDSSEEMLNKYELFINRRFPDEKVCEIIPVKIDGAYKVDGVLFICDRLLPGVSIGGTVDILIRRMFIKSNDHNILPEWAKFVKGIIDSPDLEPTAARDNFQKSDTFEFIKEKLGTLIINFLLNLAENHPHRFARVNRWHHYYLKAMALKYNDFFEKVGGLLHFETNEGTVAIRTYLTKNDPRPDYENKSPIYYFSNLSASNQFYSLAKANNWIVINAGGIFDHEYLKKFAETNKNEVVLINLEKSGDGNVFKQLMPIDREIYLKLRIDIEQILNELVPYNISVRLRKFAPDSLPALITSPDEDNATLILRKLEDYVSDFDVHGIISDAVKNNKRKIPLFLNVNVLNPLIQKLNNSDREEDDIKKIILGIYNCSILFANSDISEHNSKIMYDQFVTLFDNLIESKKNLKLLSEKVEVSRKENLSKGLSNLYEQDSISKHIVLFMITPYAEKYKKLENAVKKIFENAPYFFEVQLARDYTYSTKLVENVREHMRRADGFIAEITDLNANVMLELGAILFPNDNRPKFTIKSSEMANSIPADINDILFTQYNSLDSSLEELVNDLRVGIEKDGKPINDGIKLLIKKRGKRFLSRNVLEALAVRLEEYQIINLMKKFNDIESLTIANKEDVASIAKIEDFLANALQQELNKLIN